MKSKLGAALTRRGHRTEEALNHTDRNRPKMSKTKYIKLLEMSATTERILHSIKKVQTERYQI